jgi:hypothetical protein
VTPFGAEQLSGVEAPDGRTSGGAATLAGARLSGLDLRRSASRAELGPQIVEKLFVPEQPLKWLAEYNVQDDDAYDPRADEDQDTPR